MKYSTSCRGTQIGNGNRAVDENGDADTGASVPQRTYTSAGGTSDGSGAGSTGGGSSLNMIFHNGVDDNEISKVENMLNDMVPLDTVADELNYSFETEEYHQTPIKVEE